MLSVTRGVEREKKNQRMRNEAFVNYFGKRQLRKTNTVLSYWSPCTGRESNGVTFWMRVNKVTAWATLICIYCVSHPHTIVQQPKSGLGGLTVGHHLVAEAVTYTTHNTRDEIPWHQRDSNTLSQHSSGRRPTPSRQILYIVHQGRWDWRNKQHVWECIQIKDFNLTMEDVACTTQEVAECR